MKSMTEHFGENDEFYNSTYDKLRRAQANNRSDFYEDKLEESQAEEQPEVPRTHFQPRPILQESKNYYHQENRPVPTQQYKAPPKQEEVPEDEDEDDLSIEKIKMMLQATRADIEKMNVNHPQNYQTAVIQNNNNTQQR